jgi:deazaflavin-dependent oxidoreductase (nitroreductase family)
LIHRGRRTGLRRYTVLEVIEYRKEGPEAVVISAFGPGADWLRNIAATPDPEVIIGSRRFTATHRILDQQEAARALAGYERRNWFIAPIIRAVLSRLLGWRYDGSEEHRRRLVAQLPCIAFLPRSRPQEEANSRVRGAGPQVRSADLSPTGSSRLTPTLTRIRPLDLGARLEAIQDV